MEDDPFQLQILNDVIANHYDYKCSLASNGKLGLKAYTKRLDEIKAFMRDKISDFIRKVEVIN